MLERFLQIQISYWNSHWNHLNKSAVILLLFGLTLPASQVFAQGSPTRVRISNALQAPRCHDMLTHVGPAVERGLRQLQAQNASVYLGFYSELEDLLKSAGLSAGRARAMAIAVRELHGMTFNYPVLRFSAGVLDDMIRRDEILVCVASQNCTLAKDDQNHVLFSSAGREAILLLPPPKVSPPYFAINFFGTFSALSGERFLLHWLQAGHKLQQTGSADRYYREYAENFNGTFPPAPGSLDLGFSLAFMNLYRAYETAELYSLTFPTDSALNRDHMIRSTQAELTAGRNFQITAEVIEKLGIREDNFFEKIREILVEMEGTIARARTL